MAKEKLIYKWIPCSQYNLEAIEDWLEDMALNGYVLKSFHNFFYYATFVKTTPRHMKYRLEVSSNDSMAQIEEGVITVLEEAHVEEEEKSGWQYIAKSRFFDIYASTGYLHEKFERNIEKQAILMKKLRKGLIMELICAMLGVLLNIYQFFNHRALLNVIALNSIVCFGFLVITIVFIGNSMRDFLYFGKLSKCMKEKQEWEQGICWKHARLTHLLGVFTAVLFFISLAFGIYMNGKPDNLFKKTYDLEEYKGKVPFPTLIDFSDGSYYERVDDRRNYLETYHDVLSPINMKWVEEICMSTVAGEKLKGLLDVTYHEFIHEALAREAVREYLTARYVKAEETEQHEGIDDLTFYTYLNYDKGIVMRIGNSVYNVMFYVDGSSEHYFDREQYISLLLEKLS